MNTAYQPKTGQRCHCRRGIERDNCPQCEGTGMVIDFAAIRARTRAEVKDDQSLLIEKQEWMHKSTTI
jgi:hypothetical protein